MTEDEQKQQRSRAWNTLSALTRTLQGVLCAVCLGCSAYWTRTWAPYKLQAFQVWIMLQSVNLAIFLSITGLLLSAYMLLACKLTPKLAQQLSGIPDLALSSIYSIMFLAMAGSLTSYGGCKTSALCTAWNTTIAMGYLLWILYSISAVLAALDARKQRMPSEPVLQKEVVAATPDSQVQLNTNKEAAVNTV